MIVTWVLPVSFIVITRICLTTGLKVHRSIAPTQYGDEKQNGEGGFIKKLLLLHLVAMLNLTLCVDPQKLVNSGINNGLLQNSVQKGVALRIKNV